MSFRQTPVGAQTRRPRSANPMALVMQKAISKTAPSPSAFATLLRNSKFASYDPAIAQVYTTYGGNAHRGHWGLKRPLPIRRRKAFVTVKSVDSRQQQTEWNSGETQARFIKRWDELGVTPRYLPNTPHQRKLGVKAQVQWLVDSEFCPNEYSSETGEPNASSQSRGHYSKRTPEENTSILNIDAMTNREFARYLKKLRAKRPEFEKYLQKLGETDQNVRGKSLWEIAQETDADYHKRFIAHEMAEQYNSIDSRAIEQVPHRFGGLTYTHISPLETYLHTKPQPGFVLQKSFNPKGGRKFNEPDIASFAGMTVALHRKNAGDQDALLNLNSEEGIRKDDVERSTAKMRLAEIPLLKDTPNVVGMVRQGLKGASLELSVISEDRTDFSRSNPYKPGSREYVGSDRVLTRGRHALPVNLAGTSPGPRTPALLKQESRAKESATKKMLIESLRNIVKMNSGPDGNTAL